MAVAIYLSCHSARSFFSSFLCPLGHLRTAAYPFDQLQISKGVRCATCRRAYTANKYYCACGTSWVTCSRHFASFDFCARPPKRPRPSLEPFTAEQSSRKLRKLEPTSPVLFLGPKLAAKFPQLQARSSSSSSEHMSTSSCSIRPGAAAAAAAAHRSIRPGAAGCAASSTAAAPHLESSHVLNV